MPNRVRTISARIFIAVFLLLAMSDPSFAQLYGTAVSKLDNTSAPSPNKKWLVSVKINKEGLPILTIQKEPDGRPEDLMDVSRSGWVLWSMDSKTFAFTDAAFANHYFVHLCSAETSGTQCRDISPEIEDRVKKSLSTKTKIDNLYSKALKWTSSDKLIVGVHTVTSPEMEPGQTRVPVRYWFGAFLVNARTGRIIKKLTQEQACLELGANLNQLEW